MGRRGKAAGGPSRANNGIVLEFAKPTAQSSSTTTTPRKTDVGVAAVKSLPRSASASPIFADEGEGHYERCTSKTCDKESVLSLVKYWSNGTKRRQDLRTRNKNPAYEEFEALRRAKKLDATLKRCTGFVKRLKNCSGQQAETAEKEVEVLNLTKYLSEICAAITENRLKDRNHVWDILSVCSKIHQRYPDFASSLMDIYKTKFSSKSPAESDWNILGADLRLLTEFMICGILGDEAFPLIQIGLRQFVSSRDISAHMNIMLSFVKEFGLDVAGIFPNSVQIMCNTFDIAEPSSDLLNSQKRSKIRLLINEYMNNVYTSLVKLHDELNNSQLICRKLLKTKGEVYKDREDLHKDLVASFDRFLTSTKKLSFYTDTVIPELQELPPDEDDIDIPNAEDDCHPTEGMNRSTFFDDEETRAFYQDLPELTKYLTNAAKRENTAIMEQQAAAVAEAEANLDEETEMAELQSDEGLGNVPIEMDPEPAEILAVSVSMENLVFDEPLPKYAEYIDSLRNCVNRNMIDDAAEMFMANFNTKPNRKRLIKELCHIPRQRVDLLPLWARLIAVLNPVVPEIGASVIDFLKKELWFLLKKCHPTFIENKLKISRFLAELVNFEILPHVDAFHCLRRLILNFQHHELEMSCAFVECCGRYLYKNPATTRRMKLYMDSMDRKRQAKALDPRLADLVEQAFYSVLPRVEKKKRKQTPVLELYLKDKLYYKLSRRNADWTLRMLRTLDIKNPKAFRIALKVFTQPWKVPTNRLGLLCGLLSRYEDYQPYFVNAIAETAMIQARHGIPRVNVLNNQIMVSLINYICDLFCYQIYSCETILKLLYYFITQGVATDYRKPSRLDPPRSSFRLRLVTLLLKGCGDYFLDDSAMAMKLYIYVLYLQRYMYFKAEDPIWNKAHTPYSYEPFQVVEDLIAHLFPKKKIYKSYELACRKVKQVEREFEKLSDKYKWIPKPQPVRQLRIQGLFKIQECEENESTAQWNHVAKFGPGSHGAVGYESVAEPFFHPTCSEFNLNLVGLNLMMGDGVQVETGDDDGGEHHDEDELVEATPAEGMEFDRQLGRLFSDAVVQREARSVNTDIRIPLNLEKRGGRGEPEEQQPGTVAYAILLKKGNKSNIKHVDVPEESEFVKRMRDREKLEREERAQIKAKTLAFKRLQDNEEMMEQFQGSQFHFVKKF